MIVNEEIRLKYRYISTRGNQLYADEAEPHQKTGHFGDAGGSGGSEIRVGYVERLEIYRENETSMAGVHVTEAKAGT